ncbi:MAG TPA: metallophosphoesterase [Oligoflexia bacterium]|nr:metallophosphoesterase [Oligoflexia bacterium]HMP27210.1 metallophosphoesterase [Oligoflexia bacterium]
MSNRKSLYIMPDIHADILALRRILRRIPKNANVVFIGDIVNKGASSLGAISLLRKHYQSKKWKLLWGNHDLLFVRAMLGSREAQIKLFSQRDGGLIFGELGKPHLVKRVESIFRSFYDLLSRPRLLATAMEENKVLLQEVDATLQAHKRLRESVEWMAQHFQLFYLAPNNVLYLHAGIPVTDKGSPKLGLKQLGVMNRDVSSKLALGRLDSKVFSRLDRSEHSPLRVIKWIDKICNPSDFCERFGVCAIVVGHAEVVLDEVVSGKFPIVRHDFGAAKCKGDRPSLLEVTGSLCFISHLYLNGRWQSIFRGKI